MPVTDPPWPVLSVLSVCPAVLNCMIWPLLTPTKKLGVSLTDTVLDAPFELLPLLSVATTLTVNVPAVTKVCVPVEPD